jgi:hypothetical protein
VIAMLAACDGAGSGASLGDASPADLGEDPISAERARDVAAPTDDPKDGANESDAPGPRDLFNGHDFTGWEKYLGPPYGSTEPLGANDPKGIFSVVETDNAPAIRISGEVWGALTTIEEYGNYHLRAEFKWGPLPVWPPLTGRDSGLMYHSVGPFGAVKAGGGPLADPPGSGWFMRSMEFQIANGDLGSYYALGPITVNDGVYFVPAAEQHEDEVGTWNIVEVFVYGNDSVQLVNGHPVVRVTGATLVENDDVRPLKRGKIQLQSESMEIYFRAVTIEPIAAIPPALR